MRKWKIYLITYLIRKWKMMFSTTLQPNQHHQMYFVSLRPLCYWTDPRIQRKSPCTWKLVLFYPIFYRSTNFIQNITYIHSKKFFKWVNIRSFLKACILFSFPLYSLLIAYCLYLSKIYITIRMYCPVICAAGGTA